jgi:hypothetical protein
MKPLLQAALALGIVCSSLPYLAVAQSDSDRLAKTAIAPPAIRIETSLKAALQEVKGLRAQLATLPATAPEAMDHIRIYEREILEQARSVSTHQMHLQSQAKRLPQVNSTNEFRLANSALSELKSLIRQWAARANSPSYWKDRDRAFADLDSLEKRLDGAVGKLHSLSSKFEIRKAA